MGINMAELSSDRALVCHRDINGPEGGARVHCVLLSDGFLLECGTGYGEERARIIADMINAGGPERLSRQALRRPPTPADGPQAAE